MFSFTYLSFDGKEIVRFYMDDTLVIQGRHKLQTQQFGSQSRGRLLQTHMNWISHVSAEAKTQCWNIKWASNAMYLGSSNVL